ncbi:hypothetical protein [Streptomyces sp. NPDC001781]
MGTVTTRTLAHALRRVDQLQVQRRRIARSLARCAPGSPLHEDLAGQLAELDEQTAHWQGVVAQAEAQGLKTWSREDFTAGDFVRVRETWFEVLRVNSRSVTVPLRAPDAGGDVVRRGPGRTECTRTVGYHDGITGRMSADAMAERHPG